MTDRERWIVYPLLFLALGSALRDKLAKQTQAKQIICEQLLLVDNEGRPAAVLSGEGLEFNRGSGYVKAAAVDALQLSQFGRPVLTVGPPQALLQQLLPQLRLAPGLPQTQPAPPAPGQDPPPADEAPETPPEQPANPPESEPAPAA